MFSSFQIFGEWGGGIRYECINDNIHYLFFIFRDDGTCKHCVALLFSLSSFPDRHRDRFTEACTDQECQWDKSKKISVPMEIDDIDIRVDQSSDAPIVPIPKNNVPYSINIPMREIEKEVFPLMKGSNAVLLHTMDPPSDDSDIY